MRVGTNCAQCGSAYPPYEQLTRNAEKQWSDDSITTQLKDVFKELFPSLPKAAQEKLKTSFPALIQTPEPSKPHFPGTAAEADSEFKLFELKDTKSSNKR